MPYYVIFSTVNSINTFVNLFEANDDAHARAEYSKHIPDHLDYLQQQLSYKRCEFDALQYRLRMARPQLGPEIYINMFGHGPLYIMAENGQPQLPHNEISLSSSLNQLSILVNNMKNIFHFIEPDRNNMNVYGHLVRNTILLAAMEFENECKGVLTANGYKPIGGSNRWSTVDFVKVLQPLRLAEYELQLEYYPAIQLRSPFASWNAQATTQSLPWYDAYNAVKHERETNFHRATVEHALDAVSACAIMLAAQYRIIYNWKDQIGDFFKFSKSPEWPLEQRYVNRIDPNHPKRWGAVLYNFN